MGRGERSEIIDHIFFSVQASGTTRVLAKHCGFIKKAISSSAFGQHTS